jgi:hypothetical protein
VFTFLVNKSISLGKFPEKLKEAQVVPYKKSNALDTSPHTVLEQHFATCRTGINKFLW